MKMFLIVSCLAVATLAAPDAKADALIHGNALIHAGHVAPAWPSHVGYGHQSTCYGCRILYHKRSADADPYFGYGYTVPHIYGYGHGIAYHGGHATSFEARSPQGLSVHRYHHIGKRSADADADADAYLTHGYVLPYVLPIVRPVSEYGLSQLHPTGHSFQSVSRVHKREATAEPEADAYYGYGHRYGLGYGHLYGHGLYHHGYGYGHRYGYGGYPYGK